jgi:hypothetical protein
MLIRIAIVIFMAMMLTGAVVSGAVLWVIQKTNHQIDREYRYECTDGYSTPWTGRRQFIHSRAPIIEAYGTSYHIPQGVACSQFHRQIGE